MVLTVSMLKLKYSQYSNILDKIKRETRDGKLIRLTNGIYETDSTVDPMFLAQPILSPSYISFDYALSYYGLIPERVSAITSASLNVRKRKTYKNNFGRFEYSDIPARCFPYDILLINQKEYCCKIATKEKALCDSLYKWSKVSSIKDLKILLFEDKRIDEEEFKSLDFNEILKIAPLYRKTNLNLLVKLVKKKYINE